MTSDNLDSATTNEVMQLFAALNREGITVVMVTHEQEVAAHAGRLLTFKDGHLQADTRTPSAEAPS